MNTTQAALRYRGAGLAPIPIWPDKRKNPKLTSIQEYTQRLPRYSEVVVWFNRWPGANIGLITGYWGYIALDFDDVESYLAWKSGNNLKRSWTVQTARGFHVWFKVLFDPGKSKNYSQGDHSLLLRAKGGYCIAPPSKHHTGAMYQTVYRVKPLKISSIDEILTGWHSEPAAAPNLRPEPILPELGGKIRIEDLVTIPQGNKPNSRGAIQCFCPFHQDNRPSAWVNIGQQRFGCNACWPGLWWDTANVVAKLKGISEGEALQMVRGECEV